MIIVRLMGGLGNQMFQYAAGKRLALKRRVELKLDMDFFNRDRKRVYELDSFPLIDGHASRGEVRRLKYHSRPRWLLMTRAARRKAMAASPTLVREKSFRFDKNVLQLGDEAYLDGYWQSEKYFSDIRDHLRRQFQPVEISRSAEEMAVTIRSCISVSLHVRRSDYIKSKTASRVFEELDSGYYGSALKVIESRTRIDRVFVFSDDIDWVNENLSLDHPVTIADQGQDRPPAESMYLMSLCDHNITANSSFSWWGSWLNRNPEKIVVAPTRWFRNPEVNTQDLVPDTWVRI